MVVGNPQLTQEEVYLFDRGGDIPVLCIRSGALRAWLRSNFKDQVCDITFPADETLDSIITRHGLEATRMASMTEQEAKEPVIVGAWDDGTHLLIDGGHRRWFWAKRGCHVLKGWTVPEACWRMFVLDRSAALAVNAAQPWNF